MVSSFLMFLCILCIHSSFPLLLAQQSYIGKYFTNCKITNNTSSVLGYSCNGRPTCPAYLVFRSRSPYESVASVSHLLTSDPSLLSQLNSVSRTATFPNNKEIIAPVECACSGEFYQANSSYVVVHGDTQFIIANYTYQGLTTCHALLYQNRDKPRILFSGTNLTVPVRCACPTRRQINSGVKFLLTYTVTAGDSVPSISQRIGVEPQSIVDANELSGDGQYLFPFTTLLIPLNNRPRIAPSPPPPSPPPPPPPSFSASGKISRKRRWVLVVSGCSTGVLVLLVSFIIFYIFYRGKSGKVDQTTAAVKRENFVNPHHKLVNPEELLAGVADVCCTLRDYQFEELQLATENFSTTRAIRGTLYQGILDGNAFVIKKVDADASKEISLLSRLNHFNIFRLLGFSVNQGQCYLVFEYAEKGLLTDWIHDKSESKFLSWTQRVQIAMDVSNGLNYLHNYIEPGQVHMDVTSSGVFLNSDLRAKIANFETVKLAEGGEGRYALTRHITGSKGYMAPEYLEHGLVSANVDVYAFGVVMLETVSGKKAVIVGERRDVFLAEAFIDFMSEEEALGERTEDFIDPFLHGKYPLDLAMLIFKLIGSCLSRDPENRPSMVEIVQVLSKLLDASLNWEQSVCGYEIQIVNGPAG
ncbi:lysM domain receptor-like kinase 4 [Aristolochia californica]|uniref:lysM domain receptor-like kinase 4 n=1 Tax=Aristolochia californica TaxID=171875 RepID=UPI0035DC6B5A